MSLPTPALALGVGVCLAGLPAPASSQTSPPLAAEWDRSAAAAYLDARQTWWMSWPRADRKALSDEAQMMSATASACVRSNRPLMNALRVNSPGLANLAPWLKISWRIFDETWEPPCALNSIMCSLV